MRRIPVGSSAFLAVIGILLLSSFTATQVRRGERFDVEIANGREAVAREVLVKLRPPFQPASLGRIAAAFDAETMMAIGRPGLFRIRSRSLNTTALLAAFTSHPDVLYAEPNFVVHALNEPNDPMFPQLWGLKNIGQSVNAGLAGGFGSDVHVTDAWDLASGSAANVVAIVDTGIDYNHSDLAANMWSAPAPFTVTIGTHAVTCAAGTHGFNAILKTCDPMDDHNHGTHVSGTIGASGNNGIGVSGINWTASLMGLKFLDSGGTGTVADAIDAIEFAIQAKEAFAGTAGANVRVLSNSWGGGDFSQALLDAISAANDHDMLFVAAAGNNGFSNDILPMYPASYDAPNVVSVAATTNTDARAYFSNYGAHSVHLGAPGVDILSTIRGDSYGFLSGTSMATPHVSGAAALVLSQCVLDTAQLKETLLASVDPVSSLTSTTITGGRLDVSNALRSCLAPPSTPAGLRAISGDTRIGLTWSVVTGATSYRVKRSLTAGGPYVVAASNIKAPQYTDTGLVNGTTYYYVVSAVNVRGESGDSNEAAATPRLSADLVVSAFTTPGAAGAGTRVAVSLTTKNQGVGTADVSATRLYLSKNSIWDTADILLDQAQDVPALAPGATASASISVTIPQGTGPGLNYLIAKADADDVVLESQEGNNTAARIVQIGPDLVVSSLAVPSMVASGATIIVTDTVKNQGGDPASLSVTRFYFSSNPLLDSTDTVLGTRQVETLAAGASSTGQTTVTIPASLGMGTYYLIAEADATRVVAEAVETNNTATRAVQTGPDLVVSALTVPATGGGVITVTDTTTNQGTSDVASTVTRFYLSTNSLLDSTDVLLQDGRTIPALGPGASDSGSTTLTIPVNTPAGTYYVIARADSDNTTAETQEANNTLARVVQIGGDLVIAALTVPSKLGAGGSFAVIDTTKNQGGGDIGLSSTQFYLSTDALLGANDLLLNGSRVVPALRAGESSTGSSTVTIPAGLASGSYYFFAKADGPDAVGEVKENNNTSLKLVSIGPDLVESGLSLPTAIKAGSVVQASETVTNQGGGDAGPSVVRFYLSTNFTLDAGDIPLNATRSVPGLLAGASSAGSSPMTIPLGTAPGFYYVLAKADADGAIDESSETNNTAPRGFQVTN